MGCTTNRRKSGRRRFFRLRVPSCLIFFQITEPEPAVIHINVKTETLRDEGHLDRKPESTTASFATTADNV